MVIIVDDLANKLVEFSGRLYHYRDVCARWKLLSYRQYQHHPQRWRIECHDSFRKNISMERHEHYDER